jgi:hypothetical protein
MDQALQGQIEAYRSRLRTLIQRGCDLRDALTADPSNESWLAVLRNWQQDCGVTVNELSGGSKAHWLARSFSEAFLLRSPVGGAVEGVAPTEIVKRLIAVLEQAVASLSRKEDVAVLSGSTEAPPPRLFQFVHNSELRPVLEQAYLQSRRAFEQQDYDHALSISCGILEAIVTDALEHKGLSALAAAGVPPGTIADWSFQTRLIVAERAGLIRGGWARLPEVAWTYRDNGDDAQRRAVSERDARQTGQVLRVVMRDLDPGR